MKKKEKKKFKKVRLVILLILWEMKLENNLDDHAQ